MASFTGVGDNLVLDVPAKDEDISIDISGTYDMTILFQRELGSKGSGAFVTLDTFSTANATVAQTYKTESHNERLRLIVDVDNSGTATATLADSSDKIVSTITDEEGNNILEARQSGVTVPGTLDVTGATTLTGDVTLAGELTLNGGLIGPDVVAITANTVLTQAAHSGRTMVFSDVDGATLTLPAATGTGDIYRFAVAATVTSNSDIVQVANATDEFVGNLFQIDTDTSDAVAAYPALDADGFDTVTLNGTTTGGIMGDYFEIQDVATGKFNIRGTVLCSGTPATPLSAAVS